MKKLLTLTTLAAFTLCIGLHAQYDHPRNKNFWEQNQLNLDKFASLETTLGTLARYSDVIGVGLVSDKTNDHFTITIDHAIFGCTNGAVLVVYANIKEWDFEYPEYLLEERMPTNLSRIVIAAHTNAYTSYARMYWNDAEIPAEPKYILDHLSLKYFN